MVKITIKKSTKNIGLHYIISRNGKPLEFRTTKREAEKFAKRLRKKTTTKLLSERQKNWKLIGKRRITRNKRRRR